MNDYERAINDVANLEFPYHEIRIGGKIVQVIEAEFVAASLHRLIWEEDSCTNTEQG